ncbi:MAG TPA: cytochrome c [Terriglobales bacterium]|nr:cytochrome c [Terriglobales bacterium]
MSRTLSTVVVVTVLCMCHFSFAQSNGEALFNGQCAKCHGKDGAGKTDVAAKLSIPDLASRSVQSMSDAEIYDSIARGTKHKEYPHGYEFRGMSKADINALVKHIRSMAKK